MTNATSITLQGNSNFTARVLASHPSKLPTRFAATRRSRDCKENFESVRSLALDLQVCGHWRAHVTSSRDVVSASPIHQRIRLLGSKLLSNMLDLECNCSPEYKIANLASKMHLPNEQPFKNSRSVHTDFKRTQLTHTYKTDRRLNSAAVQHEISTVYAQLCSCHLVPVTSEKSPTTNARPPSRPLWVLYQPFTIKLSP